MFSSEATVAADGSYRIDHVPPGDAEVCFVVPFYHSGGLSSYGYEQRTKVTLKPGQSTTVNIGGMGRAVIGRVVIPPSIAGQIDWTASQCEFSSRLHLPGRALPADWDRMDVQAKAKWNDQWRQSPDVRRYEEGFPKNIQYYPVKQEPSGSFRVEDVLPGTYIFVVQARSALRPPNPSRPPTRNSPSTQCQTAAATSRSTSAPSASPN